MAEDAITLLNYVGWTKQQDLHVVSMSMGGMIALGRMSLLSKPVITIAIHKLQNWRQGFMTVSSH